MDFSLGEFVRFSPAKIYPPQTDFRLYSQTEAVPKFITADFSEVIILLCIAAEVPVIGKDREPG